MCVSLRVPDTKQALIAGTVGSALAADRPPDDVAAVPECGPWHIVPRRVGTEEDVVVPDDVLRVGHMLPEPEAHRFARIPVVDDPWVVEDLGVPALGRVSTEGGQPHGEHLNVGVRILAEDLVLHPTGALVADASGGREEHDEPSFPGAPVEGRPQLGNPANGCELGRW